MLELDLALAPFAKDIYPTLNADDQAIYRKLLACEDTELFSWVLQKAEPEDADLAKMIVHVLEYTKTRKT